MNRPLSSSPSEEASKPESAAGIRASPASPSSPGSRSGVGREADALVFSNEARGFMKIIFRKERKDTPVVRVGYTSAPRVPCAHSPSNKHTQDFWGKTKKISLVAWEHARDLPCLVMGLCPDKPTVSEKYLKSEMHLGHRTY